VASSGEHGYEPLGSIKDEAFLDELSYYKCLKKSAAWS
jgi:hypothetical protein